MTKSVWDLGLDPGIGKEYEWENGEISLNKV